MHKCLTQETRSDGRPKRVGLIYKPQFIKFRSYFMDNIMHKGALWNARLRFASTEYATRRHEWTGARFWARQRGPGLPPNGSHSLQVFGGEWAFYHVPSRRLAAAKVLKAPAAACVSCKSSAVSKPQQCWNNILHSDLINYTGWSSLNRLQT